MPKEGVSLLGHDDILRYEEIERIVQVAVSLGIIKVRLTGGEPLIRRGLLEFLKSLNSLEGLQEVTLTTNGILLEEMALPLYESGIRRINISLDSLKPDKYHYITRGGDLKKVLNGIRLAHQKGFAPIKINVVIMKGFNDDEIEDFASVAIRNPYQVRFIELMTFGSNFLEQTEYLSNQEVIARIKARHELIPVLTESRDKGPANVYRIKGALGEIGFINAGNKHLCKTCNRLRLTADGRLRACLLSENELDLKSILRSGCSNIDIERAIKEAISAKAEIREQDRKNDQIRKCVRPMYAIGG